MSVSRPPNLHVGDQVLLGGAAHTVIAVSAHEVQLADVTGTEVTLPRARMLADPGFAVVTARAPLPPPDLLQGLPAEAAARVRWWEEHIIEVLTGAPPQDGGHRPAKIEYGPQRSLRQRELAKVDELRATGHEVTLRTLQRMRRRYETEGLLGLVDGRSVRPPSVTGRVDERVVEAVRQAVREQTDVSTGTVGRLRRRVEKILAAQPADQEPVVMPSRATFYRLVERVAAGKHTFGSARTRQSLAKQPARPFGTVTAFRPGEWMQIDSTPLNVRVALDNGIVDRVELTWLVDLATRTIPAAVLSPTTKAVDASLLLARSLVPEPMRPGWRDALRMARSVLPHRRLTEIDERLEHAAARPVIVPETVVCDHGKVYMSETFRNACRAMGINFQPTHEGSPWEKGTVETSFSSVDTLFAQYVAGYVGNSVENRGRNAEQGAVWSMIELQELLDEWLVACWQNRPHDGLRDPLTPGDPLTPNEKYAALIETAGYVPVPLSEHDYIELLPAIWRTVNSYGVKISHRKYDCRALDPYRRQHSGVTAKKGLWEVHHDPYDVSRIWIRNHHDGGWIQAPWTHLKTTPAPFGEQAWQHARQTVARRGQDPVTEAEIAQAVTDLLDQAERGPERDQPSKTSRKVAARTRATARRKQQVPQPPAQPQEEEPSAVAPVEQEQLADVIPLGIFNAHEEARRRW
ncbi:Mu transposase-like protein [Krasilnikovia cinnamomea]|uniref:Mu transposase-like protein n=1 Tax=Krasilnikovia cinnamomea TaxID=349313 RepID=A0A4V2G748_9ACTN|nr:Mu transposase C-terminal domain-containing protein [Krasilnikovia cinnamomea]RZU51196.1 Mu transposase-like protein [Krasilnikovia cinnamomea]